MIKRPSIVNASSMVQMITDRRRVNASFVVANFFSSTCPFSAELAPLFGTLPFFFGENVQFVAMDAHKDRQLNMRYSIGGYPTVLCFGRGRLLARYADKPTLQTLIDFVKQNTNSTPLVSASSLHVQPPFDRDIYSGGGGWLVYLSALVAGIVWHSFVAASSSFCAPPLLALLLLLVVLVLLKIQITVLLPHVRQVS